MENQMHDEIILKPVQDSSDSIGIYRGIHIDLLIISIKYSKIRSI